MWYRGLILKSVANEEDYCLVLVFNLASGFSRHSWIFTAFILSKHANLSLL